MTTKKGKKRLRNLPVYHDELKKQRAVWLTDFAWDKARELAVRNGVSTSEFVEGLIRNYNHTDG